MDISVNVNAVQPTAAAQGSSSVAGNASPVAATVKTDPPATLEKVKPAREDLEKAVKSIQDFADSSQRNLKFSIDDKTHQVVVKVIATLTGVVVRQIPDEAAVKLAQSLSDTGSMIFDEKA